MEGTACMELRSPNDVWVLWASRRTVPKGFRVHRNTHPWWQYLLVERGDVLAMVGGTYALLSDMHAALIPGDETHSFYATTDAQIIEVKFTIEEPTLRKSLQTARRTMGETSPRIASVVNALIDEGVEREALFQSMASLLLSQLLILHIRLGRQEGHAHKPRSSRVNIKHSTLRSIGASDEKSTGKTIVAKVIEYMDTHLQDELTLAHLAQRFGYTRSYLCQIFSTTVGVSPIRFLTLLRLDRAKELLAHSTFSLARISALTGFSSVHHLWRVCRSETNLSPTDYRKLHANANAADIHFHGSNPGDVTVSSIPFFP